MIRAPNQCVSCPNLLSTSAQSDPLCCRYMLVAPVAIGRCTLTGHISVATNTEKLIKLIDSSGVSQTEISKRMEEMVQATKASEASAINQEGIAAQITYLFTSKTSLASSRGIIEGLIEEIQSADQELVPQSKAPLLRLFRPKSTGTSEGNQPETKMQGWRRYRI